MIHHNMLRARISILLSDAELVASGDLRYLCFVGEPYRVVSMVDEKVWHPCFVARQALRDRTGYV